MYHKQSKWDLMKKNTLGTLHMRKTKDRYINHNILSHN